ncbi:MAG: hypothetical protein OEZ02_12995, partial [Anaerolineae bacterium]|nr:hypothetical protein [Anaerolineae bacterium]
MRYHSGITKYTEADLKFSPWVPFQAELAIPWPVVINWVGMWVTVQYRDAQGNLSLVYSDDISVEGMPAPSTGTP